MDFISDQKQLFLTGLPQLPFVLIKLLQCNSFDSIGKIGISNLDIRKVGNKNGVKSSFSCSKYQDFKGNDDL